MGYLNQFPNTNFYQADLGFLIKNFKELKKLYIELLEKYKDNEELLNEIKNEIKIEVNNVINELVKEGKIFIKLEYDEPNKSLNFIFDMEGENSNESI